ncbi:MAG: N-6 DNA methylase [Tannerella sp.]|jgi:type I restriction enzyme M protein|nr:N-6 DNA methylase [Tannerella sp.]
MTLAEILKDSDYKQSQFNIIQIHEFEQKIIVRQDKNGKDIPYIHCAVRNKEIKLTPEEVVRQLYIQKLIDEYGYGKEQIDVEVAVPTGRATDHDKRADIVIYEDERKLTWYIVVEVKQAAVKNEKEIREAKEQLSSYCLNKGASIAVLCNGSSVEEFFYNRQNSGNKTQTLEKLSYLPKVTQTLSDVLNIHYTLKNLIENDELQNKTLKQIVQGLEDIVMANSGADAFEEVFKLIFTKLYDEFLSREDADTIAILQQNAKQTLQQIDDKDFRQLEFRNTGTESECFKRVTALFNKAKKQWKGIFDDAAAFNLSPAELKICVSFMQDVKLFNSNLEVVDDAFEYLVNKEQKGDKGQYFTPRYVIDMCVKMLNPKENETMIDTAAGSCGFPMHTIFHVWKQLNPTAENLFTTKSRTQKELDYVKNNVFAIEMDAKSVRVGRTLNLIAGDGHTNVLCLNSLDYHRWNNQTTMPQWLATYNEGFRRLENLQTNANSYAEFNFDILMANPPFAGENLPDNVIACYPNLGKKDDGKLIKNVGRDILFIERNLNFIKPGGRMAIVLPQGRFNNSSDKRIREFIAEHCRILAVVGLHGNTFKPHTGTKTSVLLLQKWDDLTPCPSPNGEGRKGLCPRCDDYPIFFATMQEQGKDNSGEKIYRTNAQGEKVRDTHGHLIVKHDLYNHDGLTQDSIAEAFAEFAKKEQLSFF